MIIELITVPRVMVELSAKVPALVLVVPNPKATERFFDFFTSNIRNKHTRRAYLQRGVPVLRMVRRQGSARPSPSETYAYRGLHRSPRLLTHMPD